MCSAESCGTNIQPVPWTSGRSLPCIFPLRLSNRSSWWPAAFRAGRISIFRLKLRPSCSEQFGALLSISSPRCFPWRHGCWTGDMQVLSSAILQVCIRKWRLCWTCRSCRMNPLSWFLLQIAMSNACRCLLRGKPTGVSGSPVMRPHPWMKSHLAHRPGRRWPTKMRKVPFSVSYAICLLAV